jgi:hypothetical protein
VQGEDGTVTLFIDTAAARVNVRNLVRRPTALLLQSPSGDQWYIRVTDRKRTTAPGVAGDTVDLDYVEVTAP